MPTINLILSITLISTFCLIGIYPLPINLAFAETTSEQQESPSSQQQESPKGWWQKFLDKGPSVRETQAGSGSR